MLLNGQFPGRGDRGPRHHTRVERKVEGGDSGLGGRGILDSIFLPLYFATGSLRRNRPQGEPVKF